VKRHPARGVALVTALVISTVLFILGSAFLVHLQEDFSAHRQRQYAVQAEWNARAGIEYFKFQRTLPKADPKTGLRTYLLDEGSTMNRCHVYQEKEGLRFEGVCRGISRNLILLNGGGGRILRALE
jgi:hypothetical protein